MSLKDLFHNWQDPRLSELRALRRERRGLIRYFSNFQTEFYRRHPTVPLRAKQVLDIEMARREFHAIHRKINELEEQIRTLERQIWGRGE
ncbi:MAG: hypothetical protein ACWA44_00980 [Thiotrichales bacterium]